MQPRLDPPAGRAAQAVPPLWEPEVVVWLKEKERLMTLRIKDWDINFEKNRTRAIVGQLKWLALKINHDSDGYTELVDHQSGAAHFGCWIALLQVAARCQPRGTLMRKCGNSHDLDSLARITRLPGNLFQEAVPRLIKIGWIEEIEPKNPIWHEGADKAHLGVSTGHNSTVHNRTEDLSLSGKKKKPKKIFSETSSEYRVAKFLLDCIRFNNPDHKTPNMQTWSKEVDSILRLDKRPFTEVCEIIKWCQGDSFWKANILSPVKLREQYDRLKIRKTEKTNWSTNYERQQSNMDDQWAQTKSELAQLEGVQAQGVVPPQCHDKQDIADGPAAGQNGGGVAGYAFTHPDG